ncbi:hypothetical protein BTVI_105520 [Pitangus sulphuratus]|nr:hypothetical protein BTVI_105520 [Pitangus sulphuratus]
MLKSQRAEQAFDQCYVSDIQETSSSSIQGVVFHEQRQQEEDGLQSKLYEANGNAAIDGIGLELQLLNGLEGERQTEEQSETTPSGLTWSQ